jgi:hypothetical protein
MKATLLLCLLLGSLPLAAQGRHVAEDDSVVRVVRRIAFVLAPDRILAHERRLDLNATQREALRALISDGRAQFAPLARTLRDAQARLDQMAAGDVVDEATSLRAFDQVLAAEDEIKRLQLRLQIRAGNLLSAEQKRRFITLERSRQ